MELFSDLKSYIWHGLFSFLFLILRLSSVADDKFLESLFEILIIIPWIVKAILMEPKIYLKTLSLRNLNISHKTIFKISNCEISKSTYKELENHMVRMNKSENRMNPDRIIKSTCVQFDNYCITEFSLDSTLVTLQYDPEAKILLLNSESTMAYKGFLGFSKKLLNQINRFFQSNRVEYCDEHDLKLQISIKFKDEANESDVKCFNPLWRKIFGSFDIQTVKLNYIGKYKSIILLTNDKIKITSNDINGIEKDILRELTFKG